MEQQHVLRMIERMVEGSTQKQVAVQLGISEAYLSDIINEKRNPGPSVLKALGLQQRTVYSKINDASA